jgi:hypothetical protein
MTPGTLTVSATRVAAFPGDPVDFEVEPPTGSADSDVRWSGGGSPADATGRRFRTAFATGGLHTVTAACADATGKLEVAIAPIDAWLTRARTFYGPAIDFAPVTVTTSWAVRGSPGTAWTCHGAIRFKRPTARTDLPDESTLIHELAHVWESQHGEAQLLAGIVEQIGRAFGRDPYDYGGPQGLRSTRRIEDLRKESQARVVTELWKSKHGHTTDDHGVPYATPGYLEDLRRLVEGAGIGRTSGARRTIPGVVDGALARVVNAVLR